MVAPIAPQAPSSATPLVLIRCTVVASLRSRAAMGGDGEFEQGDVLRAGAGRARNCHMIKDIIIHLQKQNP